MCNADARDHRRVAKDGWPAGEVVEESNSGAKKNRRDVDVDFVEEASIQALLDGVSAVDPNGLRGVEVAFRGALSRIVRPTPLGGERAFSFSSTAAAPILPRAPRYG